MWVLFIFMVMQTPEGPALRAAPVHGQFESLGECQQAQREYLEEVGEPPVGAGFGCARIPQVGRDA